MPTLLGFSACPPPSAFKNCLKHMEKILAFVGGAKVVIIIPLPRYVLTGCCKDTIHVSNRLSGELAAEFSGAKKCMFEAAAMGERTGKARLPNILSFFGSCKSAPQDLTTVDGASIWDGDGVHLTSNAGRVTARKLMADLAKVGKEGERAAKRSRLESVVPSPAPAKKKVAANGQPPSSPPRPCPPPPPLWLSGQLLWSQRGRPVQGSPRVGNRGANREQRGPLKGGQRGRWGRW
jgi:hypothetical protein